MSAPVKKCEVCDDTGSKSREMDADLDCTACSSADERVAMGKELGPMSQLAEIFAWRAYQLGKAAAAPVVPVAAQPAWKALSDVQWMNIVNHEHAYDLYSKDDAVHLAVKMTEAKCKELNAGPHAAQPVAYAHEKSLAEMNQQLSSGYPHDLGMVVLARSEHDHDIPLYAAPSLEAQPAGEVASAPNAALVAALQQACDLIKREVADGEHTEQYHRAQDALSAARQEVGHG